MIQAVDFQQFVALARAGHNRIPLVRSLQADLDTPLSAYLKLAAAPNSFLLESVVGGERFGRYSFIGLPARTRIEARDRDIRLKVAGAPDFTLQGDPLQFVEAYLSQFKAARVEGLPRFAGGLAGYFGYETIRYIEPRLDQATAKSRPDPMGLPDVLLLLTEELAVFDNLAGRLSLWVYAESGDLRSGAQLPAPWPEVRLRQAYDAAMARLDALVAQLKAPFVPPEAESFPPTEIRRDFSKEDFLKAVASAKEYIAAGDVMQVVIGQVLQKPFKGSALSLYRALRGLNPSPYMYFYDMGDFQIAGASPEILVRQDEVAGEPQGSTRVTIRPIAGTRPRGKTPAQDQALEQELRADPKECAEHLMLIDLARNDVGRIAQTGTVKVNEQMVVERYSHVMHLVSDVEGILKPELSAMDVLRASFPAGTLSGAPKIRALEIIDALEPVKRGLYGGACGYLSFTGEMDLAIAIRTGVLKDETLYVQAGAGIVADSIPESEWQETESKARAVMRAAEIAEKGLEP
ncbi:MAG: anthranilate synthase component I [Burkholderiaceae bacterium]